VVTQQIKVQPFQFYRLFVWLKRDGFAVNHALLHITSHDGSRTHTQWNLGLTKAQLESKDWVRFGIVFNTLDAEEITLQVGSEWGGAGTIWLDDLALEPAGMLLILRRDTVPLVVTSADGKTVYTEGKDFKPVVDPDIKAFPQEGEMGITHDAPALELTEGSAIRDGQRLLVSFFHAYQIDADQHVVSVQEPKVLELWDRTMAEMVKVWKCPGYCMSGYDEIRIGGWEPQPAGESLTPGQMLARHTIKARAIIKKYAPDATVYTWSDMYTPYHNGRPFRPEGQKTGAYYWLCKGNWDGAWEGLPNDIVMLNWYAPDNRSPKFFADRGFKQILCGFYDVKGTDALKKNIHTWKTATAGVAGVTGVMYTTWRNNFRDMPEFFQLWDHYADWSPSMTIPAKK